MRVDGLDETLELLASGAEGGGVEALTLGARGQAAILNAQGEHATALKVAEHALGERADAGLDPSRQELLVQALAASLALGGPGTRPWPAGADRHAAPSL